MKDFVHIHSSGRFNRSPESLAAASKQYQTEADLITYTEVDFPDRKQALREATARGYKTLTGTKGHADDCAIQWDAERFELLYEESFQNSTVQIFRTDGHPRDMPYSRIAVFKDLRNGRIFVVSVSHYASSVESELYHKNQTYRRAIQWRQSTKNSKRRVNQLAKQYKASARLVIGDFNTNFKKLWVRAMVKAFAPSYSVTWKDTNVAGGTHGNRIIDATLLRGKIKVRSSATLHKDDVSSDHRPYSETLIWQ